MNNRDVFLTDPTTIHLLNQGVAKVAELEDAKQLQTLRFELQTFVCEGRYEQGLCRIFEAFLKHLAKDKPEQPAVWVSGFYGSGKSHLIRVTADYAAVAVVQHESRPWDTEARTQSRLL